MAKRTKTNRRLTEELLETALDMRASGLMSKAAHEKITMRHLGEGIAASPAVVPTGKEIRAIREKAQLSQAVFARCLKLTVAYLSHSTLAKNLPLAPRLSCSTSFDAKAFR